MNLINKTLKNVFTIKSTNRSCRHLQIKKAYPLTCRKRTGKCLMYPLDTFFCVSVQKHVIINYIKYALITICRHAIKDRILSNMNILQKCYRIFSILLIFLFFCYIVLLHKLKKYNVHALMNGYSYDLSRIRLRKEAL